MTPTSLQRSNLARVALAMLEHSTRFDATFDMLDFAHSRTGLPDPHDIRDECGTSCCFAGHGPLVLGPTSHTCWTEYTDHTFGELTDEEFSFLFGKLWPDDPRQAAARAYRLLTDGVPNGWSFYSTYPVPSGPDFDQFILPATDTAQ